MKLFEVVFIVGFEPMVASLWYAVEGLYDLEYKALLLGDSL